MPFVLFVFTRHVFNLAEIGDFWTTAMDEAKAEQAMTQLLEDEELQPGTYRNFDYQYAEDGDGAGGIVDDALIVTDSAEAFPVPSPLTAATVGSGESRMRRKPA